MGPVRASGVAGPAAAARGDRPGGSALAAVRVGDRAVAGGAAGGRRAGQRAGERRGAGDRAGAPLVAAVRARGRGDRSRRRRGDDDEPGGPDGQRGWGGERRRRAAGARAASGGARGADRGVARARQPVRHRGAAHPADAAARGGDRRRRDDHLARPTASDGAASTQGRRRGAGRFAGEALGGRQHARPVASRHVGRYPAGGRAAGCRAPWTGAAQADGQRGCGDP